MINTVSTNNTNPDGRKIPFPLRVISLTFGLFSCEQHSSTIIKTRVLNTQSERHIYLSVIQHSHILSDNFNTPANRIQMHHLHFIYWVFKLTVESSTSEKTAFRRKSTKNSTFIPFGSTSAQYIYHNIIFLL